MLSRLTSTSIMTRLVVMVVLSALGMGAICLVASAIVSDRIMAERQAATRTVVETASGVVEHYGSLAAAGELTEQEAQDAAVAAVSALRYSGEAVSSKTNGPRDEVMTKGYVAVIAQVDATRALHASVSPPSRYSSGMGLFAELRDAFRRGRTGAPESADTTAPAPAVSLRPKRPQTARGLAKELHAEFPDRVPTDDLFERAEAAGLDVQAVDRALDDIREAASVKVLRVRVSALTVVDLASLDSVRTRIKGSSYYVTGAERRKYGGLEYLLIREPENGTDSSAVAVYGRGRKVGHLSAARAASLTPLLDDLGADAYRVTGTGTSSNSIVLWVDAPKVDALRKFVRARR